MPRSEQRQEFARADLKGNIFECEHRFAAGRPICVAHMLDEDLRTVFIGIVAHRVLSKLLRGNDVGGRRSSQWPSTPVRPDSRAALAHRDYPEKIRAILSQTCPNTLGAPPALPGAVEV